MDKYNIYLFLIILSSFLLICLIGYYGINYLLENFHHGWLI